MGGDADSLRRCYQVLDLEPGASPEAVRQSYQDLLIIWHPERLSEYPALQRKARRKVKELEAAYERLLRQWPVVDAEVMAPAAAPAAVAPARTPVAAPAAVALARTPVAVALPSFLRKELRLSPEASEGIMAAMILLAVVVIVVVFSMAIRQLTTSPVPVALLP